MEVMGDDGHSTSRQGDGSGPGHRPHAAQRGDRPVRTQFVRVDRRRSAAHRGGDLLRARQCEFRQQDDVGAGGFGAGGGGAGVAGFFSRRMAKTALPLASAAIVANGLQGTYLHMRGIGQKPGGWSNARYNIEMGPPLLAPLLVTMVGGMGLLAAVLRREK